MSTTTISVGISIQVAVRLRGDFDGEINLNGLQFGFHRGRDFYPTIEDSHFPSAISADQEIKTSRDGARVEKKNPQSGIPTCHQFDLLSAAKGSDVLSDLTINSTLSIQHGRIQTRIQDRR